MSTDITTATETQLPKVYEAAKQALATCAKIDECKSWADKSAAIASYAKQAEDDTLLKHARRIQLRAVKRMGELLEDVEPARGGDRRSTGGQPPVDSRRSVARAAGLSEHQQKQALRVARVPDDDFEAQVEGDSPPTVTQLAEAGKVVNAGLARAAKKALGDRDPADVRRTGPIHGAIERLHEAISGHSPKVIFRGFMEHEIEPAMLHASEVEEWLCDLIAVELREYRGEVKSRGGAELDRGRANDLVTSSLFYARSVASSIDMLERIDPADAALWVESLTKYITLIEKLRGKLLEVANGTEVEVEVEAANGDGNATFASA